MCYCLLVAFKHFFYSWWGIVLMFTGSTKSMKLCHDFIPCFAGTWLNSRCSSLLNRLVHFTCDAMSRLGFGGATLDSNYGLSKFSSLFRYKKAMHIKQHPGSFS